MMRVDITTGARLHFGLICGSQETGWEFGGIGMMLRNPSWKISLLAPNSGDDKIAAGSEAGMRIRDFLRQIRATRSLSPVDVVVADEVPFHTGFGSGTQLGLALAAAAELLSGHRAVHNPYELAQLAQRAERSAIGTVGFRDGGFLIDHGIAKNPSTPRQVDRISIPENWRFVLVRPAQARGLCGDQERSFFNKRIHMPNAIVSQLANVIEQQLVPSIRHDDFDIFAASLESYGGVVGSFYATQQGDVFAHPVIRKLVARVLKHGVRGAAQSSWGPGICIPARSVSHATSIAELIPDSINNAPLAVDIAEPLNIGASIRTSGPETSGGQLA